MSSFYVRTAPGGQSCYLPTRASSLDETGTTGATGPKGATGATSLSYYNTTQDLAAGDRIHVGITYSNDSNTNTTHDLTIQLDMF